MLLIHKPYWNICEILRKIIGLIPWIHSNFQDTNVFPKSLKFPGKEKYAPCQQQRSICLCTFPHACWAQVRNDSRPVTSQRKSLSKLWLQNHFGEFQQDKDNCQIGCDPSDLPWWLPEEVLHQDEAANEDPSIQRNLRPRWESLFPGSCAGESHGSGVPGTGSKQNTGWGKELFQNHRVV